MTTLLLVEDDDAARLALGRMLEYAGYSVDLAARSAEALAQLATTIYAVVISDMRLPDGTGIDVLAAALAQPNPPEVLLLTGYATLETTIAALRLGAYDYLLKPCPPPQLLAAVAAALAKHQSSHRHATALRSLVDGVTQLQSQFGQQTDDVAAVSVVTSDVLTFGELYIGRFPHESRLCGNPLHLTPIEHALLRSLVEASGAVVSYSEIVRLTHGYSTGDAEAQALLKSHVRNLRRKTGANLIVNVRNAGYRLADAADALQL